MADGLLLDDAPNPCGGGVPTGSSRPRFVDVRSRRSSARTVLSDLVGSDREVLRTPSPPVRRDDSLEAPAGTADAELTSAGLEFPSARALEGSDDWPIHGYEEPSGSIEHMLTGAPEWLEADEKESVDLAADRESVCSWTSTGGVGKQQSSPRRSHSAAGTPTLRRKLSSASAGAFGIGGGSTPTNVHRRQSAHAAYGGSPRRMPRSMSSGMVGNGGGSGNPQHRMSMPSMSSSPMSCSGSPPDRPKGDVSVCVRLRPGPRHEMCIFAESANCVRMRPVFAQTRPFSSNPSFLDEYKDSKEAIYWCDDAFGPDSAQESVYDKTAAPICEAVLEGYNGAVIAYGQTGSGKTHTIVGDAHNKGVIPRAVATIFSALQARKHWSVEICVLEIYNEKTRDLLAPGSHVTGVDIHEIMHGDGPSSFQCPDATRRQVTSPEEAIAALLEGLRRRETAPTDMNHQSSRSHLIYTLNITQLALVIYRLTTGSGVKHVPYRDSMLTRLLADSFGGSSKTCLIITCSALIRDREETRCALEFGKRANLVKNVAQINIDMAQEPSDVVKALVAKELSELKLKHANLQSALREAVGEVANQHRLRKRDLGQSQKDKAELQQRWLHSAEVAAEVQEESAAEIARLREEQHALHQWLQEVAGELSRLENEKALLQQQLVEALQAGSMQAAAVQERAEEALNASKRAQEWRAAIEETSTARGKELRDELAAAKDQTGRQTRGCDDRLHELDAEAREFKQRWGTLASDPDDDSSNNAPCSLSDTPLEALTMQLPVPHRRATISGATGEGLFNSEFSSLPPMPGETVLLSSPSPDFEEAAEPNLEESSNLADSF